MRVYASPSRAPARRPAPLTSRHTGYDDDAGRFTTSTPGSLAEVAELLGRLETVAADHYVYALTDYREVDRSVPLASSACLSFQDSTGDSTKIAGTAHIPAPTRHFMGLADPKKGLMGAPGIEPVSPGEPPFAA